MSLISDAIYAVVGLLSSPLWGYRLLRTGKYKTDWAARLGRTTVGPSDKPTLLIHAVSVGEVNATRQLVEKLRGRHEDWRIVIATTTDTGFARATALFGNVVRYPLDFTFAVRRFLDRVRPDLVVLMELEVWPTFVAEAAKRGAKVMVANGRLSARSFKRYKLIRPLVRGAFSRLSIAAVQDRAYAQRFAYMGVREERVQIVGTMKWDTARLVDSVPGADVLAAAMGIDRGLPLIVCGSSGPGEEKLFTEKLGDLSYGGKPVQLLIAPRKPERGDEAATAMVSPGGAPVRRSKCPDGTIRAVDGNRRFLLDSVGDLAKAYTLADVVVVGRSFCPLYGSDMMEPVALGKPVVIGPNTSDFADTMEKLLAGRGIVQLAGGEQLRAAVEELLDPTRGRALAQRGRRVIVDNQGATDRHVKLIEAMMEQPVAGTRPRD